MPVMARVVIPVGLLALVACGGDGDGDGEAIGDGANTTDADATTTTEGSTTTTVSDEDEVLAAYQAAKEAVGEAVDPPDADHPDLLATYTGEALERMQGSIRQLAAQGFGGRQTFESNPSDVRIEGDTATLVDCFVDRSEIYALADGQPQGPVQETVRLVEVTMERVDGDWRLARSEPKEESCTPG